MLERAIFLRAFLDCQNFTTLRNIMLVFLDIYIGNIWLLESLELLRGPLFLHCKANLAAHRHRDFMACRLPVNLHDQPLVNHLFKFSELRLN